MHRIRFGDSENYRPLIEKKVDASRFDLEFGSLRTSADLASFDCVIPLTLRDYYDLRENPGAAGARYWAPTADAVALCHDKLALNQFLLKTNRPWLIPQIYEPGQTAAYPYVLKKRCDEGGANSLIIHDAVEEDHHATLVADPQYFRQAYIGGNLEYALHLLLIRGVIHYHQTVEYSYDRDLYVKSNTNPPATTVYLCDSPHLLALAGAVSGLGFSGTCCVNYKLHEARPRVLEINPRFGASLAGDIDRYISAYLEALRLLGR